MDHTKNARHPFASTPHRTLVRLAVPVLFSLVAEPFTGLADTAFVARLGPEPLAALGIGAMAFSAVFWAFNFLGIGSQTETAKALGRGDEIRAVRLCSLAVGLGGLLGFGLFLAVMPFLPAVASLLGGQGSVQELAVSYMRYRLLGAPAVLMTMACFGVLRGMQDMRTPLLVAVGVNGLNVLLDWLLVFGMGPLPAMGVAGAALASSLSQWCGAIWILTVVRSRLGLTRHVDRSQARTLFAIGGDLFVRTGLVLVFLSLCTRVANQSGANVGAAHQAIRQVFVFAALFLDAFAVSGQSLVGYFMGRDELAMARRVAGMVVGWSLATGTALGAVMLLFASPVAWLLVPPTAVEVFLPAWTAVAVMQPMSSLSYATDGIHWGTGDFGFLRNSMLLASVSGGVAVLLVQAVAPSHSLVWIWLATGLWSAVRSGLGIARVWPGIGKAPLGPGKRSSEDF